MAEPQNFANHPKFVPGFHFVTVGILGERVTRSRA